MDRKSIEKMYVSFVCPVTEYCSVVWVGSYHSNLVKLERFQIDALRLITGATFRAIISELYEETKFFTIKPRTDIASLIMFYKMKNNLASQIII